MNLLERVSLGVRALVHGVRSRNPYDRMGPVARNLAGMQARADAMRADADRVAALAVQAEARWHEAEQAGSPRTDELKRAYETAARLASQLQSTNSLLQKALDKTAARMQGGSLPASAETVGVPADTPIAQAPPVPADADAAPPAADLGERMQRLADPNDMGASRGSGPH